MRSTRFRVSAPKILITVALSGCFFLDVAPLLAEPVLARPTLDFLNSIGVNSSFPDRGQPLDRTITMIRYVGFRWLRAGTEGLTERGPTTVQTYLDLNRETGVRFSWGMMSGGSDVEKLTTTARPLAKAGALLAFEGNNEPNNWPVTFQGETGGQNTSWLPVAQLQKHLYQSIKSDPVLAPYPVWSPSEVGAQSDNVGLQFLKIPPHAPTLMPEGTSYADAANVHNYLYHPNAPTPADNKVWDAADPTSASRVDGLYGNFGKTWRRGFQGYDEAQLSSLPRVTTETGTGIGGAITERMHGLHLMNLYLAQFKRGFNYTAVYILRDRTDEAGNQAFGFFRPDYTPRPAATYLHNLIAILDDKGRPSTNHELDYVIEKKPVTVHDLLLEKSDGGFQLVLWGEKLRGDDMLKVKFGLPMKAVIYDPTIGTQSLEERSSAEISLTLSDHPVVLTLSRL